jgi:hypothetical protein
MNPVDGLVRYLDLVQRRIRFITRVKGAAIVAVAALALTLTLAGFMAQAAFTPAALIACRALLLLGIAAAVGFALVIPLFVLTRRAVVQLLEQKCNGFEQRLLTFTERHRQQPADPFLSILAADTFTVASGAGPETFATKGMLVGLSAMAAAAGVALIWLLLLGHGRVAYDAQTLWAFRNSFRIELKAETKSVSRGFDLPVIADLQGFTAAQADLWVRYADTAEWKQIAMLPADGDSQFAASLEALPQDAEFFAEAEGIRSPVLNAHALDLPHERKIQVMVGGQLLTTDGDLIGTAGPVADLTIETDRPMDGGKLIIDNGVPFAMADTRDNRTSAQVTISHDGAYHVGVTYQGEPVPVSREYMIVMRDRGSYRKGPPGTIPDGVRTEHHQAPPGYEKAVAEYFKRLHDAKR